MKIWPYLLPTALCVATLLGATTHATAQTRNGASELSVLSALPVAVSVSTATLVLSGAATLTVVAVEKASDGTVWVLERASDGAKASVRFSTQAAGAVSMATGTAVVASAVSAGWVLQSAGKAIAFVPNELGRSLLHHERMTK